MTKKQLLNKISKLDEKNRLVYEKKSKLEQEILFLDLEMYQIMEEYNQLVWELLETNQ